MMRITRRNVCLAVFMIVVFVVCNGSAFADKEMISIGGGAVTFGPGEGVEIVTGPGEGVELIESKDKRNAVVTGKVVSIELTSGSKNGKYSGAIDKNGVPHGNGKFETKNKAGIAWYYEGEFKKGKFDGQGVIVWEDGQREEGTYKDNVLNGIGRRYAGDELIFEGVYKDGVRGGGSGKLFAGGEIVYEGLFENGLPDEKQFKEQCQTVTYEDVARRPDYFKGRPIKIVGKVLQVIDHDEIQVDYRIGTGRYQRDSFYLGYDRPKGETRVLKDDTITAWGICRGLFTYDNHYWSKVTIPGMMGYYIEIE